MDGLRMLIETSGDGITGFSGITTPAWQVKNDGHFVFFAFTLAGAEANGFVAMQLEIKVGY
jgi:hypothetical protein